MTFPYMAAIVREQMKSREFFGTGNTLAGINFTNINVANNSFFANINLDKQRLL